MYGYCLVTMSALRRRPHTGIAIRLILRRVKAERQQGSWSASYRWVGAAVVAPSHQPTEHPTDKGRSTHRATKRFLATTISVLTSLWQTAVLGLGTRNRLSLAPSLTCGFGVEPPRRNRTSDPIHAIDAREVHDAMQHLTSPYNCADGKALPRVGTWGSVRMRVAWFLANLWQGPCVVV